MVKCLFKEVKDEIFSFDRFNHGQTIIIDRSGHTMWSWRAKDKLTFKELLLSISKYAAVKVEGLETNKNLVRHFKQYKIKDIHLFYSPRTDYSFGWHNDSVNVILLVIKGKKRIHIKNKTYVLSPGESILIPKRNMHKVFNYKNTWALSIGLK